MDTLTYWLWFAAAVFSSIQDTVKFRFSLSIFYSEVFEKKCPRLYKWVRSNSHDRYIDFHNITKKKLFWIIPIPDQFSDLWHTSKWLKWVSLFGSLISFSLYNTAPKDFLGILELGIIFSLIMWVGFMVPFNIILIQKPYRSNPFDWFLQFLKKG